MSGVSAPVRVAYIDIDGTLAGAGGVHPRVWPALKRLRAAGWRIALCTGRPGRGDAMRYAARVDPTAPHVFESGAAVVDGTGAVCWFAPLGADQIARAVAFGRRHGVDIEAYDAHGTYHAEVRTDVIRRHEALLGFEARIGSLPTSGAVRVLWVVPEPRVPRFVREAEQLGGIAVHVGRSPAMPDVSFVAAIAPGISKAEGIRRSLAMLDADAADAAMMGDNLNDVPALGLVGAPIVVEDGVAEARRLARLIVPSAAEGGVADAVDWLLALPQL